jgi:imidazoleglycerol-phosphate dehydratase
MRQQRELAALSSYMDDRVRNGCRIQSDLTHEFFQGLTNHALITLHIDNLRGENAHHQCETVFKAFARALRMAAERDERAAGVIPSTKGAL